MITKPIQKSLIVDKVAAYTNEVIEEKLSESFFPSLFQTKIEKAYEIRVIYLGGKFYPMMIFSQANDMTKVDMRKYDYIRPNKRCPYKLPHEIEQKLEMFMNRLGFRYGAIDLIRGKDGQYYFLECNPNGQFNDVSALCNFNIENKIAGMLIKGNGK